jgi:membrane protein
LKTAFSTLRIANLSTAEWKRVGLRVKDEFVADQLTVIAGNVALWGVIAIFPVLIAIVSLYGLVADPTAVAGELRTLWATMPGSARSLLYEQLLQIADSSPEKLGFGVFFSLVTTLVAGSGGMHALIDGINRAYDVRETRGYLQVRLLALALTVAVVLFTVVSLALIAVLPNVLDHLGLPPVSRGVVSVARWPVLASVMMLGLSLLYRYAPNRARPKRRELNPGAVLATLIWLLASLAFGAYAAEFSNYNKTYGTLAGMVVFMLWVYISTLAILVGGELNAELERLNTERPSQAKRPRPT